MNFNTGKNNLATDHENGRHLVLDNSSKPTRGKPHPDV